MMVIMQTCVSEKAALCWGPSMVHTLFISSDESGIKLTLYPASLKIKLGDQEKPRN